MKKRNLVLMLALIFVVSAYLGYTSLRSELAISKPNAQAINDAFDVSAVTPAYGVGEREPCDDFNAMRNAYFGAVHIHTDLSSDAAAWGTLAGPADAYRFARGEPQSRRIRGEPTTELPDIQLDLPLDFAAVTDHARIDKNAMFLVVSISDQSSISNTWHYSDCLSYHYTPIPWNTTTPPNRTGLEAVTSANPHGAHRQSIGDPNMYGTLTTVSNLDGICE